MLNDTMQNPWRSPGWRWARAQAVASGDGPLSTPRRDGPEGYKWIRRAARFSQMLAHVEDDAGAQWQLMMQFPEIFWAHWAYIRDEYPIRWSIEAHLLARETNKEIAWKLGCLPGTIEAYEAIFFNVREKLNYREYIISHVLSASVLAGVLDRNHDLLWKLFGYEGGPHVLDAMIGKLVSPVWCNRPDDVSKFFQSTAINIMKKKAAVASLTVPINSNTTLHLIEAFVKYVEIESNSNSLGKAQDQIIANLSAMLGVLPFGVATKKEGRDKGMIPAYDGTSIELHADELTVVGAGLHLPGGEELRALGFPEPPAPRMDDTHETTKQGSGKPDPPGKRKRRRSGEPGPDAQPSDR